MSYSTHPGQPHNFADLALSQPLLDALANSGYTSPTPIQHEMIPCLLAGRDVIGQAQTGTGKTAAFALPLLQKLTLAKKTAPQVIVLAPTRELAIQVSQSFIRYGKGLKKLSVLPIYGGQEYATQLRGLQRGVHVVVGTPGRIIDHIRRGSLDLAGITSVVLDEADEMLNMGFLEDVEWILDQAPGDKQMALFSATMPPSIRRIARKHLQNPVEIKMDGKSSSTPKIEQCYLITNGYRAKKDALDRVLESESFAGVLVFVRTKLQTVELAEQLSAQGYSCGALNGDIAQSQRLRMVEQLKDGRLDIVVATDVAARGLDVERISHVINFDAPFDGEAYVHRIGRTGRAGRKGKALLFLHPREQKMLHAFEKKSGAKPSLMKLPTPAQINTLRKETFKESISTTLEGDCSFFTTLIEEYCREHDTEPHLVAGALAKLYHDKSPLFLPQANSSSGKNIRDASKQNAPSPVRRNNKNQRHSAQDSAEQGMDRYRIEIGDNHGIKPANIVGAIANEADISSQYIGKIAIFHEYSTVDLPFGMPVEVLHHLQKARICNRMMRIRKESITLPVDELQQIRGKRKKTKSHPTPKKRKKAEIQKQTLATVAGN